MGKGAGTRPRRASRARTAPAAFKLDAACTLREAAQFKSRLLASRFSGDTVTIDGGEVQRIDTAGLQLLVAFARRETGAGRRLQWSAVSAPLREASATLGLDEALGLQAATPEAP